MLNNDQIHDVMNLLDHEFPNPEAPLTHTNAFELLVAVVLSAQCTDARVNQVTPSLFPEFNTPQKMLTLSFEELRTKIHSCGYHNQKAKSILAFSKEIIDRHNGEVPGTMEELSALSGVGRKSAGVVLCQWFKIPAFPVDTHVFRVANRLGLVQEKSRDKTNLALRERIPKNKWIDLHLQLIFHGRKSCKSQKPQCGQCPFKNICEFDGKTS